METKQNVGMYSHMIVHIILQQSTATLLPSYPGSS